MNNLLPRQLSRSDFLFWRSFWTPLCNITTLESKDIIVMKSKSPNQFLIHSATKYRYIQEYKEGTGRPLGLVGVFRGCLPLLHRFFATLICLDDSLSLPYLSEKKRYYDPSFKHSCYCCIHHWIYRLVYIQFTSLFHRTKKNIYIKFLNKMMWLHCDISF